MLRVYSRASCIGAAEHTAAQKMHGGGTISRKNAQKLKKIID
jgi:hypothetical protein